MERSVLCRGKGGGKELDNIRRVIEMGEWRWAVIDMGVHK